VLLEDLLAQEGLTGQHIAGFERDETSHTAVAQAVVSGAADTGLGIEMAAARAGWTLSLWWTSATTWPA
jgi:molybdate-binding protein